MMERYWIFQWVNDQQAGGMYDIHSRVSRLDAAIAKAEMITNDWKQGHVYDSHEDRIVWNGERVQDDIGPIMVGAPI